ncbi:MAG: hypothetical protein A4E43_01195 [Methanosaeta sp. PtaB.Bin005]|nr:MAG: hypothetical protein A4E43_01195 [Methanosaeta sp. PtaB.Bin005]
MLFELGPLQGYALGRDQGDTPSHPVGLYSVQVPVSRDLLLLGGLAVYANGAVSHNGSDLIVRGGVLQARHSLVQADLLHIALHLLRARLPGGDAHAPPHIIRNENGERLSSTPGRPYRPGIVDLQILSAVIVLSQVHPGNALHGGGYYALGEQGHRGADGALHRLDLAGPRTQPALSEVDTNGKRGLLPAQSFRFVMPDPLCNSLDADQLLHPLRQVHRQGYLHISRGVPSPAASHFGYGHGIIQAILQKLEIILVVHSSLHRLSPVMESLDLIRSGPTSS